MSDISVCRERSQNGIAHAVFRLVLQKVCSWIFIVVLSGYVLALCGLVVHTWMTDPPRWSAAPAHQRMASSKVESHWVAVGTNVVFTNANGDVMVTTSNGRPVVLNWKTTMTIRPTMKVNSEELHHWVSLDSYLRKHDLNGSNVWSAYKFWQ